MKIQPLKGDILKRYTKVIESLIFCVAIDTNMEGGVAKVIKDKCGNFGRDEEII